MTAPQRDDVAACGICQHELRFAWTDHHGIAQCVSCGAPYQLLFYEGEHRVSRPPELLIPDDDRSRIRRFHSETGARLSAVGMGLSCPGGYDVARGSDIEEWNKWELTHRGLT